MILLNKKNDIKYRLRGFFSVPLIISFLIIIFDQFSKWMIIKWVPLYDRITITSFINITHHRNTGAAFSFLADASGWQRWFLSFVALLVSLYLVFWLWNIREKKYFVLSISLAFILGGAIGNLLDRVFLGSVVDFIQVLIVGWPFPTFNIADSAITIGAILLIIDSIFFSGKTK